MALLQCSVIQTIYFLPKSTHEKYHFFSIPSFAVGVNLICKNYVNYMLFMPFFTVLDNQGKGKSYQASVLSEVSTIANMKNLMKFLQLS